MKVFCTQVQRTHIHTKVNFNTINPAFTLARGTLKQYKNNLKYNIMQTVKKIIAQEKYDRYVFLTYENGKIIGLNFHHGIDQKDFENFLEPCEKLTTIFNKTCIKKAHLNLTLKKLINISINKYYDKYLYPKETITIPTGQTNLIKEAIKFYLKGFKEFNTEPTQEENYKIFDLQQLDAMLNYKISITIETQNKENFVHHHGMDFPEY